MRIAFCVPRQSHLRPGVSGDKIYVAGLMKGLTDRGHELRVVAPFNVRDCWSGSLPLRRLLFAAFAVWLEMRRFAPDAWLVYDPSVNNPDFFGWWQRPKRYVLFHASGLSTKQPLSRWWRWLFGAVHRRSLARADGLVAYHPSAIKSLRSAGVPEELLMLAPSAPEIPVTVHSREEARVRLGLSADAPIICCATRLQEEESSTGTGARRNKTHVVIHVLDALASLAPDVHLVVVGDGSGRASVEKKIAELKLGSRVSLVGNVSNADLRWYYAACDFFAYPIEINRPFIAVMEAQACARPVVVLRNPSMELTIDDGNTGFLANDLEEFRAHMARLAGDRTLCDRMGVAAREYVSRQHSVESRVRQIEDLLMGAGQSGNR